jgi:prepilin-type N-terminal cleavage/methylation domain-containing protein
MTKRHGFGLVEVIVGLAILSIGILAAAMLQVSSLRFSSQAEQIKTVTHIAERELEWRRQRDIPELLDNAPCATEDSETCTVTITGCKIVDGLFTCASDLTSPVAYQILVSYTGPRGDAVTLRTVTTGTFVSGGAGD